MPEATLIATLGHAPSANGEDFSLLPQAVRCVEVRADLTGDLPLALLRRHFGGQLLYNLQRDAESSPQRQDRRRRLVEAAREYDLVSLDAEFDLSSEILNHVPASQRVVRQVVPASDVATLHETFRQLSLVPARYYQLVVRGQRAGDGLAALELLHALGRRDVIAYADDASGFWSRLIAPLLGAPLVFAPFPMSGSDLPDVNRLIADYGLPALPRCERLFGIVGCPVGHSLSPRIHNAAYRQMELGAVFLPFQSSSFADFWQDFIQRDTLRRLGMPIHGLTVASPNKELVLSKADLQTPVVRRAASSNIISRTNGHWTADSTDPDSVLETLRDQGAAVANQRAAVVGCGGSGRAIATALHDAGANVTLVNRTPQRGRLAADRLSLPFLPLRDFSAAGFSIVVNATPVGRDGHACPFATDRLGKGTTVVDLVYGQRTTPLIERSRAQGCSTVEGAEVLRVQAAHQFHIMTALQMPDGLVQDILHSEVVPLS